jgi:N utilization substance protein B
MKSARRRAREFALQGLYQWQLTGDDAAVITAHLAETKGFDKADRLLLDALLRGVIERAAELGAAIAPHLDRKLDELSPVERGVMLLAAFELTHMPQTPYRVVLNEAIELAKSYGGTDGHKYVNGVLDKLASAVRFDEIAAVAAARR